jgi:hypothetical protein
MATLNADTFDNTVPIPGHVEFRGLGPRHTPARRTDGEGQVVINGWPITVKWLMEPFMISNTPDYKRFCELVCTYTALNANYDIVHIR